MSTNLLLLKKEVGISDFCSLNMLLPLQRMTTFKPPLNSSFWTFFWLLERAFRNFNNYLFFFYCWGNPLFSPLFLPPFPPLWRTLCASFCAGAMLIFSVSFQFQHMCYRSNTSIVLFPLPLYYWKNLTTHPCGKLILMSITNQ